MKIADFANVRIGDMVKFKNWEVRIMDINRSEHTAQLSVTPFMSKQKWMRCSEFDLTTAEPKEPKQKKTKNRYLRRMPNEFFIVDIRRRKTQTFDSCVACSKFLGVTKYYLLKAVRERTEIKGYRVFNKTEEDMTKEEIKEVVETSRVELMQAMATGNARMVSFYRSKVDGFSKLLKEMEDEEQRFIDEGAEDPALRSFVAKTLSLSVSEADLSIYHLDLFFAFYHAVGLEKRASWQKVYDNLKSALKDFGDFSRKFLVGENIKVNMDKTCQVHDLILKNYYEEKEMSYYDKYETKAGNL